MRSAFEISDLREAPQFREAVADRVWNAWWRQKGTPLEEIQARVAENLSTDGIPLALIAHRGGSFIGTASVIHHDLEARPDLSPWVAAVWVDPPHRGAGIGAALVMSAARAGARLVGGPVHLCAAPRLASFYEGMGWQRIERDVGGLDVYRHQPQTSGTDA